MTSSPEARRWSAFFDVDGTLISIKSMFSFLDFLVEQLNWQDDARYREYRRNLQAMIEQEQPREAINRYYYRIYEGLEVARVERLGRAWYARVRRNDRLLYGRMLDELRWHQRQGASTVLLSGSFQALLAPLAEELGIDSVLAAPLETRDGHYTGNLLGEPTIGQGKARRLREYSQQQGLNASHCYAYGDDVSDLPMLEAVGHPCMVNPGPSERAICQARQWPIIQAA